MIRILFTSAVNPKSEVENRYRPLWPAFLAAYIEKNLGKKQIEFKYLAGGLKEEISSCKPDIFAISSVTQNYTYAKEHACIAKSFGIPVLVGGMHVSAMPGSLFLDADIGIIGEGEQTFLELIRHYIEYGKFKYSELEKIDGIVFRKDGAFVSTPDRRPIKDLDTIPHPKRSIIGYAKRNYLITARGCPYKCIFCICTRFWGDVRYASPEYVLEEINELIENGAKTIRFNDDNFAANRERLAKIVELITSSGIHRNARFSCWSRANNITRETVQLLKAMNVVSVVMGLESGSERTLKYLKGGVTVEQNRQAVNLLKDAGIQANADFIIGAPNETESEMMETYRFIKESRVDFVAINVFSPLPGTPVWEYAKSKNIVSDDMDWSRLNFKFNTDEKTCVHLSEALTYKDLSRIYKKFKRLETYRNLKAIPGSPWLNELPGVIVKRVIEKTSAIASRS